MSDDLSAIGNCECDEPSVFAGVRLDHEIPMRADLNLPSVDAPTQLLDLPAIVDRGGALPIVLANLLYANARAPRLHVHYSRDRSHYSRLRRYVPPGFTYRNVLGAVDILERAGLVEHLRTKPSRSATHRSRLRASTQLLERVAGFPIGYVCNPTELIVLRDRDGRLLNYDESDRIVSWRRDIAQHNEFLGGFDTRFDHPHVDDRGGLIWVAGRCIGPSRRSYARIFNVAWTQGGRWYGPYWQSLPKHLRKHLKIDAKAVVELDFRACHLRLLCGWQGVELPFDDPEFDPYAVAGFDRALVKLAFNVMLNAASERAAAAALARELREHHLAESGRMAATLMRAVAARFPGLDPFWCSGVGLQLQNADAEICRRVQQRLRKRDIPILSVHDSFLAPASHADVLDAVMQEEMLRACRKRK
jgi:hypothetical protein